MRRTFSSHGRWSIPPRKHAEREPSGKRERRQHEQRGNDHGERAQRGGIRRITALLEGEEDHAQRFRARGPQQRRHRELVERGEKDEQRTRRRGRRKQRKKDRAQSLRQMRPGDLRSFFERAIDLVITAYHGSQSE